MVTGTGEPPEGRQERPQLKVKQDTLVGYGELESYGLMSLSHDGN